MWAHGALKRIWLQLDSQHLEEIHNTPTYENDATKQFYVGQQLNDQSEKYLKFNFCLRKP